MCLLFAEQAFKILASQSTGQLRHMWRRRGRCHENLCPTMVGKHTCIQLQILHAITLVCLFVFAQFLRRRRMTFTEYCCSFCGGDVAVCNGPLQPPVISFAIHLRRRRRAWSARLAFPNVFLAFSNVGLFVYFLRCRRWRLRAEGYCLRAAS